MCFFISVSASMPVSAILPAKTESISSVFFPISFNKSLVCFKVKTAVMFSFTPSLFSFPINLEFDTDFVFIIGILTKTFSAH